MKYFLSTLSFYFICFLSFSQIVQIGQDIDGIAGDQSGYSVSLNFDGNRVAIGSPFNGFGGNSSGGAVRVYEFNGVSWVQMGQDIYGGVNDRLGNSVALSDNGDRVVIGAVGAVGGAQDGIVTVYKFDGANWNLLGQPILAETSGEWFGHSVDISGGSGDRIIAGSPYNNDNGGPDEGSARVFEFDGTNWNQVGQDLDGIGSERFGFAVSMDPSGSVIAIGGDSGPGVVRVYSLMVNVWDQVGSDLIGDQNGDAFGSSLSLSNDGEFLAVGILGGGSVGQGSVKVFGGGSSYTTQVGQTIFGANNGDWIGGRESVAINAFGNKLVIGSSLNDGNGISSGHARLFTFNTSWVQNGVVYGEIAGDEMGQVAISSNGQRIVLGARENSDAGNVAGHARVYDLGNVGVDDLSINTIVIYPNPSNGLIHFKSDQKITAVEIIDLSGRKVDLYEFNNQIQLRQTEGVYLLRVMQNGDCLGTLRIELL